jgi:hypothetical protein
VSVGKGGRIEDAFEMAEVEGDGGPAGQCEDDEEDPDEAGGWFGADVGQSRLRVNGDGRVVVGTFVDG